MSSPVVCLDAALPERYAAAALEVFDPDERRRFLDDQGRPRHPQTLPWELLYRLEPELYARLVAGERLHEGVLGWLPPRCGNVLEVGAGTGRLTLELAGRADHVDAVEPAAGLRRILERRVGEQGATNVRALRGFFDSLPTAAGTYDLVVTCSAFSVAALADPRACLVAMARHCAPGGLLVIVWPDDVGWLGARGFEHVTFEGPMLVEYRSVEEAVALARIFYPAAAAEVAARGSRFVDFATLGMNPPRDLCWRRPG